MNSLYLIGCAIIVTILTTNSSWATITSVIPRVVAKFSMFKAISTSLKRAAKMRKRREG